MKNKLKLQNIIKHIKTMFYNLVSGQFKKSQPDTISINEKNGKFDNINNKRFMSEFDEVIKKLKKHYGSFDLITSRLILDYNNGKRKTWIVDTKDKIYFIRKVDGKIFSSFTNKTDFDFQIDYIEENYNKLYVNGITTPITYDTYLSGSTSTFSSYLKNLKE